MFVSTKNAVPDQIGLFNSGPAEPDVPVVEKPKPAVKKALVKQEYNGLFFSPELGKFVDPDTDKPISDFTFENAQIMGIPANPFDYPTEDTVDWILEVIKGLPNFWYAKKIVAPWSYFDATHKQWLVEATKRDGRNLVFAPGMFASSLFRHGEQTALSGLDASFPKG
jgi:hypothetical protein